MLRSAANFDRAWGRSLATVNDEPSAAIQSAKDECDINVMVRRFGVTAVARDVPMPAGETVLEEFDFKGSLDILNAADRSFQGLSAEVRRRFGNDPRYFFEFCQQTDADGKLKNLDELRKMGLAVPAPAPVPEPPPMRVEVVNPKV